VAVVLRLTYDAFGKRSPDRFHIERVIHVTAINAMAGRPTYHSLACLQFLHLKKIIKCSLFSVVVFSISLLVLAFLEFSVHTVFI